jgi:hypothetical protein
MMQALASLAAEVQNCPPGVAVAVYELMGEPPLLDDGVHVTVADARLAMAWTPVGLEGTVGGMAGITALETMEGELVPRALMATARKV